MDGWIELFFGMGAFFSLSYTVEIMRKLRYLKNKNGTSGTFS